MKFYFSSNMSIAPFHQSSVKKKLRKRLRILLVCFMPGSLKEHTNTDLSSKGLVEGQINKDSTCTPWNSRLNAWLEKYAGCSKQGGTEKITTNCSSIGNFSCSITIKIIERTAWVFQINVTQQKVSTKFVNSWSITS